MMKRLAAALLLLAKPLSAETVAVSVADCARLANYVAGVSTTGKAVVPADLNGGYPVDEPTDFDLPIRVDLRRNYGFQESLLKYGEIPAAAVQVQDGRVFLNGKAIESADADLIARACSAVGK